MECEIVAVAGSSDPSRAKINGQDGSKKTQKRKRASAVIEKSRAEEKEARIASLREELEALSKYYRELMADADLEAARQWPSGGEVNLMVAAMMEERDLPLSKLVDVIFDAAKAVCHGLTAAMVKGAVLLVGQRVMYGVPNANADVLEDQSESCLWCWETRDVKLRPQSVRGVLSIRRTCRRRIQERIIAITEMITALETSESDQNYKVNLLKASSKLSKAQSEAAIRQLYARLMEKNGSDMAQKEAQKEEKLLVKQLDKGKREAEKERKRLEREALKEKLQNEKEQKRLREEAEKDARRREKEESEVKRQMKKQQEEAEKDQRRREKEEAEQKKRASIQKQASIMERFIKRSKPNPLPTDQSHISKESTASSEFSSKKNEKVPMAATQSMDSALLSNGNLNIQEMCKLHLLSWRRLGQSIRSNKKQHWGTRQKPKTDIFKQLKLTTGRPIVVVMDDSEDEKLVDEFGVCSSDDRSCEINASCSLPDVKRFIRGKQLLQFDKSHRPAFYGTWPKKSHVVGPRHPLRMDPDLDYDVDSDEEWEEDDPGESLSDCDKDDEDETLQEGGSKADDVDDSEDEFFVPDGYLSENEGVQDDVMDTEVTVEAQSSPGVECEELCALFRQQKYLNNMTDHALRKNQLLIISNLMHEKASLLAAEDLTGIPKLEQTCLQALSMRVFPGSSFIEITLDIMEDINGEPCVKDNATPAKTPTSLADEDLRTIVSGIQSSSQGIHKLAECLQQKLPRFSKSQLRSKVRELSDFVDNKWQVKKQVLKELGFSVTPEKSLGRTKSIAAFFSKRCLPPANESINLNAN